MDFEHILYEENEATAIIKINRPKVYNALNFEAKLEIINAVRMINKNSNIRSIILTGIDNAFCTGQDLNDRNIQASEGPVDLGHTLSNEWNPLINSLRESKKIIIGAINGVSAGAGISVAFALDLIIAKPKVKFVGAFSKLGLVPDAGSTFTFVRGLGQKKTLEFFLLGNTLYSEDFLEAKMINFIDENPLEKAIELSKQINLLAPKATEACKKNIQFALDSNYLLSEEREVYTQRALGFSEDYKEGLRAFLEKRNPNFKGI